MLTPSDRGIIRGTNSFFEYQKAQELCKGIATRQYVATYLDYHLSSDGGLVRVPRHDFEGNWKDSFDNCNVSVTFDMLH
jgi:hypothetical protein